MPEPLFRFAEGLRTLLNVRSPGEIERAWTRSRLDVLGWSALRRAWQLDWARWERVLDECDGLLLRLLDRLPVLAAGADPRSVHVRTFRAPALERLQHATAAALVVQRYGVAGLRTVIADDAAPLARRYFSFLALAFRHPPGEWPLFERYLVARAHHAFVGAAAEAARFYPRGAAAPRLMHLFDSVRADLHLRAFLSPRILGSLHVLRDPATLEFFRGLLTAGFTDVDPEYCEVTRALVIVRRLTGRLEESAKYRDPCAAGVREAVDLAERLYDRRRSAIRVVQVI
jgi:hypothetical protein